VGKAYVILTEAIHDRAGMEAYGHASGPTLGEFGGQVIVVNEQPLVLEGSWPDVRTVIVEFESVERAQAWYSSPGYQAALTLRQAAAECNVVIVPGFAPRAATG
jgi:uncharacterized protein (DUF1330 family)